MWKSLSGGVIVNVEYPPNKALQLTANPLRGLSAAELGRYILPLTTQMRCK